MADLEAVLADVSYLMAMEKSKSSINSTKNGRRLTLPDRDSSNVIKRYLEDRGDLSFDKVFEEKIGYALFVTFCSKKHSFSVPIVFYQQIEGLNESINTFGSFNYSIEYKSANVEPDERLKLAKEIYDTFVMRELLVRQRRKDSSVVTQSPDSSPPPTTPKNHATPNIESNTTFPLESAFQGKILDTLVEMFVRTSRP